MTEAQDNAGRDAQIVLDARRVGHPIKPCHKVFDVEDADRQTRVESEVGTATQQQRETIFAGGLATECSAYTRPTRERLAEGCPMAPFAGETDARADRIGKQVPIDALRLSSKVVAAEIGSGIKPRLCAPSDRDASAVGIEGLSSAIGTGMKEGIADSESELRFLAAAGLRQKEKKGQANP